MRELMSPEASELAQSFWLMNTVLLNDSELIWKSSSPIFAEKSETSRFVSAFLNTKVSSASFDPKNLSII